MSELDKSKYPVSTRRAFLKGGINLTRAVLAAHYIPSWQLDLGGAKDEVGLLKGEIERQFNINLTTVNEIYGGSEVIRWDVSTLQLLRRSLDNLPRYFLQVSQLGELVSISLDLGERANCSCGQEHILPHRINIGVEYFHSLRKPLPKLAHELVHLITPIEGSRQTPSEFASVWYQRVDVILGMPFEAARPQLAAVVRAKINALDPTLLENKEKLEDYETFYYGVEGFAMAAYGYRLPHEFIAVLGENYVNGKEYFYSIYGEFFSSEQVVEFYNFVKDDIFKGVEYLESLDLRTE